MSAVSGSTAIVLGATGLVGTELVRQLLNDSRYARVRILVRREPHERSHPKLDCRRVSFDDLSSELFAGGEHVYSCLGTTIKQAGSRAAFRRVDFDYVVQAARLAGQAGARKFLLVSSVGANARSPFFYTRVKGETEDAVAEAGVPEVHVFRPSFLLGERGGSRPLEELSIAVARPLSTLMAGPLRRYRPIEARDVARAMVARAFDEARGGLKVHEGKGLTA